MEACPAMEQHASLIDAGIRLLDEQGPEALNARMLAAEVGASTMAVYSNFGGMAGLYQALVRESFVRFGARLRDMRRTDDPVADVMTLGLAYRNQALASPQRFRLMFGVTGPEIGPNIGHDLTTEGTPTVLPEVNATFELLAELVGRCISDGRIRPADSTVVAGQVWSMVHGFVLLELAGVFGNEGQGVPCVLAPHAVNLLVGLGDSCEAAELSAIAAAEATSAPAPPGRQATPTVRRGRPPGRPKPAH